MNKYAAILYNDAKPRNRFYTAVGKYPKNLYMGFEHEITRKDEYGPIYGRENDCEESIELEKFLVKRCKKHFYIKYDGSCDVEVVSEPFNWNYYKKNSKFYNQILSFVKKHAVDSPKDTGFHIHFSKRFFTEAHIARLIDFIRDNSEKFAEVSGRDENSLNEWASIDEISFEAYDNKYVALRKCEEIPTIEFRLFKGCVEPKMVDSYLNFGMSLMMYTKSERRPTWSGFVKYTFKNFRNGCYVIVKRTSKETTK